MINYDEVKIDHIFNVGDCRREEMWIDTSRLLPFHIIVFKEDVALKAML